MFQRETDATQSLSIPFRSSIGKQTDLFILIFFFNPFLMHCKVYLVSVNRVIVNLLPGFIHLFPEQGWL